MIVVDDGATDKDDQVRKRLNRTFETRLDSDKETLDALADLSTFFTENTIQTRRNLRSQIEQRSLAINEVGPIQWDIRYADIIITIFCSI